MAHALSPFFLIVSLPPDTRFAEAVGPEVNGVPQEFVASPAHVSLTNLARLVTHGRGAGKALEHVVIAIALGIGADGSQKPRC